MRHAVLGRKLNRDTDHRRALRRNMVQSLIEHGEVRTTLVKAKEMRRFAERLVHIAVLAADAATDKQPLRELALRQRAEALLGDRAVIAAENQKEYDALSDAKRDKVIRARSGRRYRATTTRPGVKFTASSVLNRLFTLVGPALKRRADQLGIRGGYTRVIKLSDRRLGDAGAEAILQLVREDDPRRVKNKAPTERRRRSKVRYSVYAGKPRTTRARRRTGKSAKPASSSPSTGEVAT